MKPQNYKIFFRSITYRIETKISPPALKVNNQTLTDPVQQANAFSDFFNSIDPVTTQCPLPQSRPLNFLELTHLSALDINKVIS